MSRIPGKGMDSPCAIRNLQHDAHNRGAPYPTVLRDSQPRNPQIGAYYKPTVADLADNTFATHCLEYHDDINDARPGDIVVWYGNGSHHSAIAVGDGKIIYAGSEGAKENTIEEASKTFPGVTPIIRRYVVK